MKQRLSTERIFSIFKELNQIPRPSHHEEKVADYLCEFAKQLHLEYERDSNNCVIIRKQASKGYEHAEPVVLLNHMDMVCIGMNDPLHNPIDAYIDNGWIKARGTSLGADNGIGLAMALAVLEDENIVHGPLEVIATTNEEDGMSGAEQLSSNFIHGRKVINLDSEDYDTVTTASAGACLQYHKIPMKLLPAPGGKHRWFRIRFEGGLGGHSGVDINKGRATTVITTWANLAAILNEYDFDVASINIGEANASIASTAEVIICIQSGEPAEFVKEQQESMNQWLKEEFGQSDPNMHCFIEKCPKQDMIIDRNSIEILMECLEQIPQGVVKMSNYMKNSVETSNNVGRIYTDKEHIIVSTHTRSFSDKEIENLRKDIASVFTSKGATTEIIMSAPAWQEDQNSAFLQLTSDTFYEILGFRPRMVAMHFVLEAGYLVKKFPGIQIACIGPRILEPHSISERVEISTIDDIWQVLIELLKRLS